MRPHPQWGQGWRKGGDHHFEKRISTEEKKDFSRTISRPVETVARNNPFELAVVFPDDKGTILVDINRITFKTVLESTDLHVVLERTGETFVFPGDRIVFPPFNQEIVALEFFQDPRKERCPVNFVADFRTDGGDLALESRFEFF